jgi:hypothetical protein
VQLAPWSWRAALASVAAIGAAQGASLHRHRHISHSPVGNAPIQTGAPIRAHAALHSNSNLRVLLHATNL